MEDLDKWRKYDKAKGLKREYPINAEKFEQWVRLDFDGDGVAEYTSPYELRNELMTRQFDFNNETDRYKFGRAMYHIAQRRGFKSSKGESIKDQEKEQTDNDADLDLSDAMKKSEDKKSSLLKDYMEKNELQTVGCAFYHLEKSGVRVRNSEYQAVRSQYREEIAKIFAFQKGLDNHSPFYNSLISEKKGEGTIFYKRPLRSQKGLVGKCTLEPDKDRCPVSRPEFEKFRAWSFINNIRFGKDCAEELTLDQKRKLYNERFLSVVKHDFDFSDIHKWLEKETHQKLQYPNTLNYKDKTNVSGCPVSARLKNLFGDDWENWRLETTKKDKKTQKDVTVCYDVYDIWHICFTAEDLEFVKQFAENQLKFNNAQTALLLKVFGAIQQGYSMLSLKAVKNINRFLEKGFIYTDAVLLAKLPDIFGQDKWREAESDIESNLKNLIAQNRWEKSVYNITNSLIANYKSLEVDEQFARKDTNYKLTDRDIEDIKNTTENTFGQKTWNETSENEKHIILSEVERLYQEFFASSKREYYPLHKLADTLSNYLKETYNIEPKKLAKIYHPSMIDIYAPAKEQLVGDRILKQLGSPVIGALKNPMAMRVLHSLRRIVNSLLQKTDENGNALIDENTKIVVETARELNDANMRWAIETYQKQRELENKEFEELIKQYAGNSNDVNKVRLMMEQHDGNADKDENNYFEKYKKELITKYRLWAEQGCICMYTGKPINISSLFDDNAFDIEHTIPRSISFDDSLANQTICEAHFNRSIKKNMLPSQLQDYDKILERLKPWKEKIERLKERVDFWKAKSKRAQDKDTKDQCIRQRHLWQMELDYWKNKVARFETKEVNSGFRNSQLVDTRIITKYAFHYLKTVFNRVDVQKGEITACFRKIFGVQSVDEKKSRDKHSHHAIDAAVLTFIPSAAKRDRILELFYKIQEGERLHANVESLKRELNTELTKCGIRGNISQIVPFIENNILINHISKDQTLTPAHRRKRIRGRIVPKLDENGEVMFETNEDGSFKLDKYGHKIPQAKQWISGDCLRGQLHQESFYGAIKLPKYDSNGKTLLRNPDGSIVTEKDVVFVIRRELKYKKNPKDSGFKNWDDLQQAIVDQSLFQTMKNQFAEDVSFKDAVEQGIKDSRHKKIRHVRCFASVKNPLEIKKQTYLSKYDYKQNYYAAMGDLAVMCKYSNDDAGKSIYKIWSLFDISKNRKLKSQDVEDIPTVIEDKKMIFHLANQIRRGDMLLLYKDYPEELHEMDNAQLSQRLYVVTGFENPSRINMVKHINAQKDSDLGKGETIKSFDEMPEKIRQGVNGLHFLIEGKDFVLEADHTITFL